MSSLQPMTPPALDRVVRTCLAKDPDDRWQTAADVTKQLKWIAEGGSHAGMLVPVITSRKGPLRNARLAWSVAAAFEVSIGARQRPNTLVEFVSDYSSSSLAALADR